MLKIYFLQPKVVGMFSYVILNKKLSVDTDVLYFH